MSACLALVLCAGAPVGAQTVQTLSIYDGKVTINGEEVPTADLPPGFDLRDINATYTFIGDARPLIEMNGELFVLDGRRLRAVARLGDEESGIEVYFRGAAEAPPAGRYGNRAVTALLSSDLAEKQARVLQAQTQELERLSNEVEQQPANQALQRARAQVAQAAEAVELLPKLEVQSYLNDVQQYNHTLYLLLVREWRMEREADHLAQEIRSLPDGALRAERVALLRNKLQEIFELKQQNRRREIEQLEQQLSSLYDRLQKREEWRERLIQQRLDHLVGTPRSPEHR